MSERKEKLSVGEHLCRITNYGMSKAKKGTPYVWIEFEEVGVDHRNIRWFGYLTDKTKERTLDRMLEMGFDGDWNGLAEGHDGSFNMEKHWTVIVEETEYEGKMSVRVKYINDPDRPHQAAPKASPDELRSFIKDLGLETLWVKRKSLASQGGNSVKELPDVPF